MGKNMWNRQAKATSLCLVSLLLFIPNIAHAALVVQSIEITGIKRTQPRTVLRELPFHKGDTWQEQWKTTAERWLRNTGLFSEVVVTPPDASGVVHIRAKERWSLWLLPQATRKDDGASSWGFNLDEYNMWGLNHHAHLEFKRDSGKNFSGSNGSSYEARYLWRRIRDSKLSVETGYSWGDSIFEAYRDGILEAEYLSHGTDAFIRFDYGLGPVPGEEWGVSLGFDASKTTFALRSGTPQPDVEDRRRNALTAGIQFRQVDDQIVWFSGTAFDYNLSVAHSAFGSTINAYRQTASIRSYIPFSGQNTLNMRLNAGLVTGDVLRDGLFDLGNRDEIRGYSPGDLQASGYIYGTLEGRYLWHPDSNVQFVAYTDIGHVRKKGHNALGKPIIAGVGTGIRWTLRWLVRGTLRADVAYGFATEEFRFYIGTGQAF